MIRSIVGMGADDRLNEYKPLGSINGKKLLEPSPRRAEQTCVYDMLSLQEGLTYELEIG